MCLEVQTFYRCPCPLPPPFTVPCETGCRMFREKIQKWAYTACPTCIDTYHTLLWLSQYRNSRGTRGTSASHPLSSQRLRASGHLERSEVPPHLKQQAAIRVRGARLQRMKRKMLSIEEILNPIAEGPGVDGMGESPSLAREDSVEEVTKEDVEKALRQKRQHSKAVGIGISKPYTAGRIRLKEMPVKRAAAG
ncbi:MAG: hypothetical protein Q9185_000031 [Variospora sp. 1 TL-2023]